MTNREFEAQRYGKVFIFICVVTAVLSSGWLFAAERADTPKPARYRIFSLKHISAEQGEEYLTGAEIICTVSRLPSPNTLLITAQPRELIRASAILKLVDAEERFVIKTILPASKAKNLPSNDKIAAELGNISIGTFSEPPAGAAPVKAIIDIHNDAVVAVAPAEKLEEIISAIEKLQSSSVVPRVSELETLEMTEQLLTTSPKPDKLFSKLLGSIADAEKKTAKIPDSNDIDLVEKEEPKPKPEPKPKAARQKSEDRSQKTEIREQKSTKSYEPMPIAGGEEELDLDLPEKLDIILLLDLLGKHLQMNYMFNEADLKGKQISLRIQGRIKVKELYPMAESALQSQGLVMTRKGNLVTVVPSSKVMEIDPTLLKADEAQVRYGDVIITRVFRLKHVDTASAENLLKGMKLGVNINPIPATGTLIVTGYTRRMARIEELLTMVDKPGKPRQFRFRQLKYTMAKTLAPKIKTLAEQLGTISITVSAPPAAIPAKPVRGRARPAPKPAPTSTPAKPTVYLDADERTNRILMIGLDEQLAVVDELIDTLDVKQQDLRTLRLYEIQYVGAEEVKQKLEELGVIGGAKATVGRSARPTRITKDTKAATPVTTGPAREPLVEEPQVVIIGSTDSLLVNATAQQHIQIATIIGYVDSEAEQAAIPYVVYPLENQDPEDLAEVLNQLVLKTITEKDKDNKIVKTTTKKIEEDIFIIPDPKTYSLIVYANKKNQQWVSSLIEQLDEYRPQVLMDVTLVEITKNEEFTYNLDLLTKYPTIPLVGVEGNIANIVSPPSRRIWETKSTAGAGGSAFYADEHIQALLDAMHEKGYGRILARPKLLVNDNEIGTIKTEEKITIVSPETTVIPGTGVTPSTGTTSVKVDTYDAGITLDIQPHISKGDQLRLQITMTRIDFRLKDDYVLTTPDGELTGPTPPDLLTSDVTTVITVPDGTTIILGGLERLKQSKGGTKVPLLGDIPIIGGLFRSTANKDEQSRLYVFVKANILRPGEEVPGASDLEIVSRKNRDAFEEFEQKFQKLENWTGIKSEPMDPLRVLEVD